jgi:hypothetical protein
VKNLLDIVHSLNIDIPPGIVRVEEVKMIILNAQVVIYRFKLDDQHILDHVKDPH